MALRISIYLAGLRNSPIPRAHLREAVRFVLQQEGVSTATVRIVLADDQTIQELNRQYLQHDYPTDVLTFVLAPTPLEAEIYIGVQQAQRQAEEYSVPLAEELIRLSIHGTLHALGYDDQTASQRQRMEAQQERYLRAFFNEALPKSIPERPPSKSSAAPS
ncbi:MAG: rRNA maturation RNase YbeY [Chlorobiota bacterium]